MPPVRPGKRRTSAKRGPKPGRSRARPSRAFVINVAVRDVMSRNPVTIGPDATLLDALVLMRGQKVSGLPVVDETRGLVGVLSQRDVARILKDAAGIPEATGFFDLLMFGLAERGGVSAESLRKILEDASVRDAMSSPPITIPADASLELAADIMRDNEINRIPVLRGERLVGIVTRHDLVRGLVRA